MKRAIVILILLSCTIAHAEHRRLAWVETWWSGDIAHPEAMTDDRFNTCGEFLADGAEMHFRYYFNSKIPMAISINVLCGHWLWTDIELPQSALDYIEQHGHFELLVEGCIRNQQVVFSWWNGAYYEFLLMAVGTTAFCHQEMVYPEVIA